jgi:hypothetical protein
MKLAKVSNATVHVTTYDDRVKVEVPWGDHGGSETLLDLRLTDGGWVVWLSGQVHAPNTNNHPDLVQSIETNPTTKGT